MKQLLTIVTVFLLSAACSEDGPASPWRFGGDVGADAVDAAECPTPTDWRVEAIEGSDSWAPQGPMLTETHLVTTRSNSLRQVWVALELETEEVVWSSPPDEQVRAASGQLVLLFAETEEGERVARIVDVSDSSQASQIDLPADVRANPNFERADQIFDGRRFVLSRRRDPDSSPGRVVYYDGESRRLVELGDSIQEGPVLINGGFAAIVRGRSNSGERTVDVVVFDERTDATERLRPSEVAERGLVSDGATAAWVTPGAVHLLRRAGTSPSKIYEGYCGRLSVAEGTLAFVCRSTETDYWPSGPASGESLKYFDGREVHTVDAANDPVYMVAHDDGAFVWIEPMFEDREVPSVGREETGRLMVAGSHGAPAVDIGARNGFPCFTCGALWPPVHLTMRGGVVGWSYDRTGRDPGEPGAPGGVGYAMSHGCP